jgi:murein DD-endopeptidase MepM/ murein hydrolase activator NlpD
MKNQKNSFIILAVFLVGFFVLPLVSNYSNATQNEKNTDNNKITFIVPIKEGTISSFFGWRESPFEEKKEFHKGIDIAAPQGTPVFASASGVITIVGWGGEYGYMVQIQHSNGYSTVYAQCERLQVKEGQTVKSGDTIATCGLTGAAAESHLHFEIRKNGEPIDPYKYLSKMPINILHK